MANDQRMDDRAGWVCMTAVWATVGAVFGLSWGVGLGLILYSFIILKEGPLDRE